MLLWAADCLEGLNEAERERLAAVKEATAASKVPLVSVKSKKQLAEWVRVRINSASRGFMSRPFSSASASMQSVDASDVHGDLCQHQKAVVIVAESFSSLYGTAGQDRPLQEGCSLPFGSCALLRGWRRQ